MSRSAAIEWRTGRHEVSFEHHDVARVSELLGLRPFVPMTGRRLEIGVGSARFAALR